MFEIAAKVMDSATYQGLDAAGKALSMDMATVAGLLDGLSLWNAAHPDMPYRYDLGTVAKALFQPRSMDFRLRGPDFKRLVIQVNADRPEVTLTRTKCGARPKAAPVWNLKFRNAAGKVLAEDTGIIENPIRKTYTLEARRGETVWLEINDDMTASWTVNVSPAFDAFAEVNADSDISAGGMRGFYFTIPAGVESFTFTMRGIHQGSFGANILDEAGTVQAKLEGLTTSVARLPWTAGDWQKTPDPVKKVTINCGRSSVPRVWRLILWAKGDASLHFDGIPSMIGITPVSPWKQN